MNLPSLSCPVPMSLEFQYRWAEIFMVVEILFRERIGEEGPDGGRVWRWREARVSQFLLIQPRRRKCGFS